MDRVERHNSEIVASLWVGVLVSGGKRIDYRWSTSQQVCLNEKLKPHTYNACLLVASTHCEHASMLIQTKWSTTMLVWLMLEENSNRLFFDKTLATFSPWCTNFANSLAQHHQRQKSWNFSTSLRMLARSYAPCWLPSTIFACTHKCYYRIFSILSRTRM